MDIITVSVKQILEMLKNQIEEYIALFSIPLIPLKENQDNINQYSLGSGTLVAIRGRKGIITAAHVWRERISAACFLGLGSRTNTTGFYPHRHLINVKILDVTMTPPAYNKEQGPDIAFIHLQNKDINIIEANGKVFYNLDIRKTIRLRSESFETGLFIVTGYPDFLARNNRQEINQFFYPTGQLGKKKGELYDIYDVSVDALYDSVGGMSGGGLWHITIKEKDGKIQLLDNRNDIKPIGVNFYEFYNENNKVYKIRC